MVRPLVPEAELCSFHSIKVFLLVMEAVMVGIDSLAPILFLQKDMEFSLELAHQGISILL